MPSAAGLTAGLSQNLKGFPDNVSMRSKSIFCISFSLCCFRTRGMRSSKNTLPKLYATSAAARVGAMCSPQFRVATSRNTQLNIPMRSTISGTFKSELPNHRLFQCKVHLESFLVRLRFLRLALAISACACERLKFWLALPSSIRCRRIANSRCSCTRSVDLRLVYRGLPRWYCSAVLRMV